MHEVIFVDYQENMSNLTYDRNHEIIQLCICHMFTTCSKEILNMFRSS